MSTNSPFEVPKHITPQMFASTTAQNPPPYYNKPATVMQSSGAMQYMRLGQSGVVVSRICLGLMSYTDGKLMYDWYDQPHITSDTSQTALLHATDSHPALLAPLSLCAG